MKKFLSVLLAAVMTVSVFAISVVPAFAAQSPTATTAEENKPQLEVNGEITKTEVTYKVEDDGEGHISATFRFVGEGRLRDWEDNLKELGFVEGKDYTTANNKDGSYTIVFLSAEAQAAFENNKVVVNAIVDRTGDGSGSTDGNDSSKSPSTGLATAAIAGTIAAAGAGFAVLSASKKKDAE